MIIKEIVLTIIRCTNSLLIVLLIEKKKKKRYPLQEDLQQSQTPSPIIFFFFHSPLSLSCVCLHSGERHFSRARATKVEKNFIRRKNSVSSPASTFTTHVNYQHTR